MGSDMPTDVRMRDAVLNVHYDPILTEILAVRRELPSSHLRPRSILKTPRAYQGGHGPMYVARDPSLSYHIRYRRNAARAARERSLDAYMEDLLNAVTSHTPLLEPTVVDQSTMQSSYDWSPMHCSDDQGIPQCLDDRATMHDHSMMHSSNVPSPMDCSDDQTAIQLPANQRVMQWLDGQSSTHSPNDPATVHRPIDQTAFQSPDHRRVMQWLDNQSDTHSSNNRATVHRANDPSTFHNSINRTAMQLPDNQTTSHCSNDQTSMQRPESQPTKQRPTDQTTLHYNNDQTNMQCPDHQPTKHDQTTLHRPQASFKSSKRPGLLSASLYNGNSMANIDPFFWTDKTRLSYPLRSLWSKQHAAEQNRLFAAAEHRKVSRGTKTPTWSRPRPTVPGPSRAFHRASAPSPAKSTNIQSLPRAAQNTSQGSMSIKRPSPPPEGDEDEAIPRGSSEPRPGAGGMMATLYSTLPRAYSALLKFIGAAPQEIVAVASDHNRRKRRAVQSKNLPSNAMPAFDTDLASEHVPDSLPNTTLHPDITAEDPSHNTHLGNATVRGSHSERLEEEMDWNVDSLSSSVMPGTFPSLSLAGKDSPHVDAVDNAAYNCSRTHLPHKTHHATLPINSHTSGLSSANSTHVAHTTNTRLAADKNPARQPPTDAAAFSKSQDVAPTQATVSISGNSSSNKPADHASSAPENPNHSSPQPALRLAPRETIYGAYVRQKMRQRVFAQLAEENWRDKQPGEPSAARDAQIDAVLTKVQQFKGISYDAGFQQRKRTELYRQARVEALESEQKLADDKAKAEAKKTEDKAAQRRERAAETRRRKDAERAKKEEDAQREIEFDAALASSRKKDVLIRPLDPIWARKLEIALSTKNDHDVLATSVDGAPLTRRDLGRLLPHAGFAAGTMNGGTALWLNDESVNAWLATLVASKLELAGYIRGNGTPPFVAYNSAWYTNYQKKGITGIASWSRRQKIPGKKLLEAERIFFPVNTGAHWILLIISPQKRKLEVLDSAHWRSIKYFNIMREWLAMELGATYNPDEWTDAPSMSGPQLNSDDCGVFVCVNALASAQDRSFKDIEPTDGMYDARCMICAVLLNGGFKGDWQL